MAKKVILTVGVPASGKTTWAKQRAMIDPDVVIVSRDDIREAHGWKSGVQEKRVTDIQRAQIEAALMDGKTVIVADTNITKKLRENLIKFCHEHGADVELVIFRTGPNIAIERDKRRDRSVGADVINRMWDKFVDQAPWNELSFPVQRFEKVAHDESKEDVVILDIDGTLARMTNRSPYDESKVLDDAPIPSVIKIANSLANDFKIIVVSGRTDKSRDDTRAWLIKHLDISHDFELYMRVPGDHRPDWIIKNEIYDKHILPFHNVVMVLDDRDQVVRHVRERGITVAQVAYGRF